VQNAARATVLSDILSAVSPRSLETDAIAGLQTRGGAREREEEDAAPRRRVYLSSAIPEAYWIRGCYEMRKVQRGRERERERETGMLRVSRHRTTAIAEASTAMAGSLPPHPYVYGDARELSIVDALVRGS